MNNLSIFNKLGLHGTAKLFCDYYGECILEKYNSVVKSNVKWNHVMGRPRSKRVCISYRIL